jgi:plastocyanin
MRTFAALVVALAVCGTWVAAGQKEQKPKPKKPVTHTVTIDATSFKPASLTIAPGDSVIWVNKDLIPHTATSKKPGIFDSGDIAPGKSWKHTFKTASGVDYVCIYHPTMKGTLAVKK